MIKYTKHITKYKWYDPIDKFLLFIVQKYCNIADDIIDNKIIKRIVGFPFILILWIFYPVNRFIFKKDTINIIRSFKNGVLEDIIGFPFVVILIIIFHLATSFARPCSCDSSVPRKNRVFKTHTCQNCWRILDWSDTSRLCQLITTSPEIINMIPEKYKDKQEVQLFIKLKG
jgi:hypothetical protein